MPLFINRKLILEFLHSLNIPGASNKLEDCLRILFRSNEMTAVLRVCTLFQIIFSDPMRWLAGKHEELKDFSIVPHARARRGDVREDRRRRARAHVDALDLGHPAVVAQARPDFGRHVHKARDHISGGSTGGSVSSAAPSATGPMGILNWSLIWAAWRAAWRPPWKLRGAHPQRVRAKTRVGVRVRNF